jgi:hypothetical protein
MTNETWVRIFTIYESPADSEGRFVVRERDVTAGNVEVGNARTAATLEEARALIPEGAVRFERSPDDDPTIVESWTLEGTGPSPPAHG